MQQPKSLHFKCPDKPLRPWPVYAAGSLLTPTQDAVATQKRSQQHHQPDAARLDDDRRQLAKLKRFLATLIQFGADINSETGLRVRHLVLELVKGRITIEAFRQGLQATTNSPLRPFVLPFLTASLPLIRAEWLGLGCLGDVGNIGGEYQLLGQLLVGGEAAATTAVGVDGLERKRPSSQAERSKDTAPPKKRLLHGHSHSSSSSSSSHSSSDVTSFSGKVNSQSATVASIVEIASRPDANCSAAAAFSSNAPQPVVSQLHQTEDEWKQLEAMLATIVDLIGTVRKSIIRLQQQQQPLKPHQFEQHQPRSPGSTVAKATETTTTTVTSDQTCGPNRRLQQQRQHIDRIVSEMRQQAQRDISQAVAISEARARDALAKERLRSEQLLAQANAAALIALRVQNSSAENCWNCGRSASETCSGCRSARYCGSFCQHRDWERHRKVCGTQQPVKDSMSFGAMSQANREGK